MAVHIGEAALDEVLRERIESIKVITGVVEMIGEREAQPLDHFLDRLFVFELFLDRIGVIEAQVTNAAIVASEAKVQANGFGVTDVQVAIGLRRKTGDHLAAVLVGQIVGINDLSNEVR